MQRRSLPSLIFHLRVEFLTALALLFSALATQPVFAADDYKFPIGIPSEMGAEKFSEKLNAFIIAAKYHQWNHDPEIRATGPYIVTTAGTIESFGTHGPGGVKVYYSPGVWAWLSGGRTGAIADGEMIVKEIFPRDPKNPEKFLNEATSYSIAIKDKKASWDGWFWSDGGPLLKPKPENALRFFDPNAGFGLSCITCHASTDNKESIFATMRNVNGPQPSFTTIVPIPMIGKATSIVDIHTPPSDERYNTETWKVPFSKKRADYWRVLDKISDGFVPEPLPFSSYDHVPQGPQPDGHKQFVTASNCSACHGATQFFSTLPNMIMPVGPKAEKLANLSPFSEWRNSMMGLSGRDPVFYAQLEAERELHPELAKEIDNTCLSCHGVMGQRQFAHDKGGDELFQHGFVTAAADKDGDHAAYGALARDGVSCAVCHRMLPDGLGTPASYTGKFKVAEKANEIFGPYQTVMTLPMEQSLGLTPKYGEQLRSSKMCGSCHTVVTPSLDRDKKYAKADVEKPAKTFHEQTTYLEWKNSEFSDEEKPDNPRKQSCQNCHMPRTYSGVGAAPLKFKIATIEDNTFPANEGRAPDAKLTLALRGEDPKEPYSRHSLHGINTFVTEMFSQFPWLLGVQRRDNLFTAENGIPGQDLALQTSLEMAQKQTAKITLFDLKRTDKGISASVKIENQAGHKFPSGVGFRRAFIEFKVTSGGQPIWVSGGTDSFGTIGITEKGVFVPLNSESLEKNQYQPHFDTITREDQVQIYELLVAGSDHHLTTSFISLRDIVKDNRILPRGWSHNGPDADLTAPVGDAKKDKDYNDGSGSDTLRYEVPLTLAPNQPLIVSATLYYQSLPPYYLKERFNFIDKPATRALFYFVNQVNLENTPMKDWKLEIASDKKSL